MKKAMYEEVTTSIPASALRLHPNCLVSLDKEAACEEACKDEK